MMSAAEGGSAELEVIRLALVDPQRHNAWADRYAPCHVRLPVNSVGRLVDAGDLDRTNLDLPMNYEQTSGVLTRRAFIIGPATLALFGGQSHQSAAQGQFVGRVVAEWLPDHRRMKLIEPFEYKEASGRRWPVPKDAVVDGASIPQVFWSIIGGPFEGPYRSPSVIHDYFCDVRRRKHEDVHRVFYDSMLNAGVGQSKAWLMFQAVRQFGPQWPDPRIPPQCEIVDANYDFTLCSQNFVRPHQILPRADRASLERFAQSIANQVAPSDLEELRRAIGKAD